MGFDFRTMWAEASQPVAVKVPQTIESQTEYVQLLRDHIDAPFDDESAGRVLDLAEQLDIPADGVIAEMGIVRSVEGLKKIAGDYDSAVDDYRQAAIDYLAKVEILNPIIAALLAQIAMAGDAVDAQARRLEIIRDAAAEIEQARSTHPHLV